MGELNIFSIINDFIQYLYVYKLNVIISYFRRGKIRDDQKASSLVSKELFLYIGCDLFPTNNKLELFYKFLNVFLGNELS